METKNRVFKNKITSTFGAILMLVALSMFLLDRLPIIEGVEFSWLEMLGTAMLGWVFLMAKDSLLEGLFLNIFKIKQNE